MSDTIAPVLPDIQLDFVVMDDAELEKLFRVIIHNDDITPYDLVLVVLCTIFELNIKRAEEITFEAHTNGLALVIILPYKEAHQKVYSAQSLARQHGYPLSFTLEADD